MNTFSKKLITAAEAVLGFVGVVMILVEAYAVFARNLFQIATPWSDELLKLLFVWAIYVGSALAFISDDLISLTLIEDHVREKGRMKVYGLLKVLQYVAAIGISGLLVKQLCTIVSTQMSTGEITTVLKYPLWVMNMGMLLGMALIVICGVWKLVDCGKYFRASEQSSAQ